MSILDVIDPTIFASVFAAGSSAGIMYAARMLPIKLFQWTRSALVTSLTLDQYDFALEGLFRYISKLDSSKKTRRIRLTEQWSNKTKEWHTAPVFGEGWHLFKSYGKYFLLTRYINSDPKSTNNKRVEHITLICFSRNPKYIHRLIQEVSKDNESDHVGVYSFQGDQYHLVDYKPFRRKETLYFSDNVLERLDRDIHTFIDSKDYYERNGIPWRRSYLLDGPPGTGKTSLAHYLASILQKDIYTINLASLKNDTALLLAFIAQQNGVVLLEDIDSCDALHRRELNDKRKVKSEITLSGILNTLDGMSSRNGQILIATTNRKEILDPAITRPGRFDVHLHISLIEDEAVVRRMAESILYEFPDSIDDFIEGFLYSYPLPQSPALIQSHLQLERNFLIRGEK